VSKYSTDSEVLGPLGWLTARFEPGTLPHHAICQPWQLLVGSVSGWINRHQDVIAYARVRKELAIPDYRFALDYRERKS